VELDEKIEVPQRVLQCLVHVISDDGNHVIGQRAAMADGPSMDVLPQNGIVVVSLALSQ